MTSSPDDRNTPDSQLIVTIQPSPAAIERSLQYDLFCTFHGLPADLSNTVELWDAIPKYIVSARTQAWAALKDKRLPLYKQTFHYEPQPRAKGRTQQLLVTIAPARFEEPDETGVMTEIEVFPSADEELIEEAIRKIFADQVNGGHDAKSARVYFTLGMVYRELRARNKTRSYKQIMRSLRIMNACNITVTPATGGRSIVASPILPNLAAVSRKDWLADPDSRFMVTFNELMHRAITNLTFRQLNYKSLMSLKSPLARWLFKRLSHEYINAGLLVPYAVSYSSIARDSGYLQNPKISRNIEKLDLALAELESARVLLSVRKETAEARVGQPTGDTMYMLTPNPDFIADVKAANSRNNAINDTARARGLKTGPLKPAAGGAPAGPAGKGLRVVGRRGR
jgi:hypothetical protein